MFAYFWEAGEIIKYDFSILAGFLWLEVESEHLPFIALGDHCNLNRYFSFFKSLLGKQKPTDVTPSMVFTEKPGS